MLSGHRSCVQKSKDTSHVVTGPCIMTCLFEVATVTNLAWCHRAFLGNVRFLSQLKNPVGNHRFGFFFFCFFFFYFPSKSIEDSL